MCSHVKSGIQCGVISGKFGVQMKATTARFSAGLYCTQLLSSCSFERSLGQNTRTSGETDEEKCRRAENPTYAVIDPQSVKTTCVADQRGFDGEQRTQQSREGYHGDNRSFEHNIISQLLKK